MVLLSGEVETAPSLCSRQAATAWFRMVLLSGEVETVWIELYDYQGRKSSGWFCYPGKLKLKLRGRAASSKRCVPDGFAIRGS